MMSMIENRTFGQELYAMRLQTDPHWKWVKKEVARVKGEWCSLCHRTDDLDWHHLSYKHMGFRREARDVVILCNKHHMLAHNWFFGKYKVPLNDFDLTLRYNFLRLQPWRYWKPSQIGKWLYEEFKIR